ncbi:hypothetical protein [Pseudoclavibacter helvolus]|uniref:hypothetical protein n=1 Tax=Pseudoclavibacter helvolus TaxID=255205 RepID=UPI000837EA77|nr:hypothetical protein [Pseudoclavibacter helvolus]
MTLTNLLPSMRRFLPSPMTLDLWPVSTQPTLTDVYSENVSMMAYAEICGTPCVHSASGAVKGSNGTRPADADCTVIVTSVTAVIKTGDEMSILLDSRLGALPCQWSEMRLLGRISPARNCRVRVLEEGMLISVILALPNDLVEGDVLALPCPGLRTHRSVSPTRDRTSHVPAACTPTKAPLALESTLQLPTPDEPEEREHALLDPVHPTVQAVPSSPGSPGLLSLARSHQTAPQQQNA